MSWHILPLPSGGTLDLDNLPEQASLEMLEACVARILLLEAHGTEDTPKKRKPPSLPASSSKAMKPAQIVKEKKSIVKDIKKTITPLKFHVGWDKVAREVRFSADRLPPEAAEELLLMSRDSWSSATVSSTLSGDDATRALSLSQGELTGAVWRKGGAMPGRRFGAVKAVRLGTAPLMVTSLKLNYTVKSQRLSGSLICINQAEVTPSGRKRRRADDMGEDGFDDVWSDDDEDSDDMLFYTER